MRPGERSYPQLLPESAGSSGGKTRLGRTTFCPELLRRARAAGSWLVTPHGLGAKAPPKTGLPLQNSPQTKDTARAGRVKLTGTCWDSWK